MAAPAVYVPFLRFIALDGATSNTLPPSLESYVVVGTQYDVGQGASLRRFTTDMRVPIRDFWFTEVNRGRRWYAQPAQAGRLAELHLRLRKSAHIPLNVDAPRLQAGPFASPERHGQEYFLPPGGEHLQAYVAQLRLQGVELVAEPGEAELARLQQVWLTLTQLASTDGLPPVPGGLNNATDQLVVEPQGALAPGQPPHRVSALLAKSPYAADASPDEEETESIGTLQAAMVDYVTRALGNPVYCHYVHVKLLELLETYPVDAVLFPPPWDDKGLAYDKWNELADELGAPAPSWRPILPAPSDESVLAVRQLLGRRMHVAQLARRVVVRGFLAPGQVIAQELGSTRLHVVLVDQSMLANPPEAPALYDRVSWLSGRSSRANPAPHTVFGVVVRGIQRGRVEVLAPGSDRPQAVAAASVRPSPFWCTPPAARLSPILTVRDKDGLRGDLESLSDDVLDTLIRASNKVRVFEFDMLKARADAGLAPASADVAAFVAGKQYAAGSPPVSRDEKTSHPNPVRVVTQATIQKRFPYPGRNLRRHPEIPPSRFAEVRGEMRNWVGRRVCHIIERKEIKQSSRSTTGAVGDIVHQFYGQVVGVFLGRVRVKKGSMKVGNLTKILEGFDVLDADAAETGEEDEEEEEEEEEEEANPAAAELFYAVKFKHLDREGEKYSGDGNRLFFATVAFTLFFSRKEMEENNTRVKNLAWCDAPERPPPLVGYKVLDKTRSKGGTRRSVRFDWPTNVSAVYWETLRLAEGTGERPTIVARVFAQPHFFAIVRSCVGTGDNEGGGQNTGSVIELDFGPHYERLHKTKTRKFTFPEAVAAHIHVLGDVRRDPKATPWSEKHKLWVHNAALAWKYADVKSKTSKQNMYVLPRQFLATKENIEYDDPRELGPAKGLLWLHWPLIRRLAALPRFAPETPVPGDDELVRRIVSRLRNFCEQSHKIIPASVLSEVAKLNKKVVVNDDDAVVSSAFPSGYFLGWSSMKVPLFSSIAASAAEEEAAEEDAVVVDSDDDDKAPAAPARGARGGEVTPLKNVAVALARCELGKEIETSVRPPQNGAAPTWFGTEAYKSRQDYIDRLNKEWEPYQDGLYLLSRTSLLLQVQMANAYAHIGTRAHLRLALRSVTATEPHRVADGTVALDQYDRNEFFFAAAEFSPADGGAFVRYPVLTPSTDAAYGVLGEVYDMAMSDEAGLYTAFSAGVLGKSPGMAALEYLVAKTFDALFGVRPGDEYFEARACAAELPVINPFLMVSKTNKKRRCLFVQTQADSVLVVKRGDDEQFVVMVDYKNRMESSPVKVLDSKEVAQVTTNARLFEAMTGIRVDYGMLVMSTRRPSELVHLTTWRLNGECTQGDTLSRARFVERTEFLCLMSPVSADCKGVYADRGSACAFSKGALAAVEEMALLSRSTLNDEPMVFTYQMPKLHVVCDRPVETEDPPNARTWRVAAPVDDPLLNGISYGWKKVKPRQPAEEEEDEEEEEEDEVQAPQQQGAAARRQGAQRAPRRSGRQSIPVIPVVPKRKRKTRKEREKEKASKERKTRQNARKTAAAKAAKALEEPSFVVYERPETQDPKQNRPPDPDELPRRDKLPPRWPPRPAPPPPPRPGTPPPPLLPPPPLMLMPPSAPAPPEPQAPPFEGEVERRGQPDGPLRNLRKRVPRHEEPGTHADRRKTLQDAVVQASEAAFGAVVNAPTRRVLFEGVDQPEALANLNSLFRHMKAFLFVESGDPALAPEPGWEQVTAPRPGAAGPGQFDDLLVQRADGVTTPVSRMGHLNAPSAAYAQPARREGRASVERAIRAGDFEGVLARTLHRLINERVQRAFVVPDAATRAMDGDDFCQQDVMVTREEAVTRFLPLSQRPFWSDAMLDFANQHVPVAAAKLRAQLRRWLDVRNV
jgi:hypothetical protein